MSRLSDPTVCPDCRAPVSPDAVCTACGLALTGPLATRLWRAMLTADDLVEQLRAQPIAAAAPIASAPAPARAHVPAVSTTPPFPPMPSSAAAQPAPSARSGLSGRAVPVILLGLGGLFVFVAVSLFLAVTWEVLPLAVKAALMLGFTATVGGVAAWTVIAAALEATLPIVMQM